MSDSHEAETAAEFFARIRGVISEPRKPIRLAMAANEFEMGLWGVAGELIDNLDTATIAAGLVLAASRMFGAMVDRPDRAAAGRLIGALMQAHIAEFVGRLDKVDDATEVVVH